MSEKRLFLAKLAEAQDSARGGPKRRAIARTAAVLVILAILVAVILWFSGFFSTPKEVLEIRAMVDQQIGELQKVARNEAPLTYDTSNFRQNWDRVRKMPPEVREQVREEMERLSRAREQAELRSYFAMPAQERLKEIDRRINAEEARRQAWRQQRTDQAAGNGPGGGQGQGGAGGQGDNARGGQGRGGAGAGSPQAGTAGPRGGGGPGSGAGPGGSAGPGAGGGGPGGGRGTEDGRNARSKQRIDSTSPEERAQRAEYRRAMDARRQQLGFSPGRGR